MASKPTTAALLLLACARVAHAQDVPPDAPPPDAPPPAPDTTDAPPVDAPPPVDTPPPAPPPPAAEHKPAPAPAPSEGGVILGVGLGVAGATGTPGDLYGPAFGLELVFGIAYRDTSVEARTGIGFSSLPKNDALAGDATRGSIDVRSIVIRQRFAPSPTIALSVAAGVATAAVPVLALGTNEFSSNVVVDELTGNGLTARGALHFQLSRHAELVGEAALYTLWWELPGHPYVTNPTPTTSPMAGTTATTFTMSTAEVSSTPWTITLGLRTTIPF